MKRILFTLTIGFALLASWGGAIAATSPVQFGSTEPAFSIWDDGSVSLALSLKNLSETSAANVRITSISLRSGTRLSPVVFPVTLGEISAERAAPVFARFSVPKVDGTRYLLTISGTYEVGGKGYGFSVNRYIAPKPVDLGPFQTLAFSSQKFDRVSATDLYRPVEPGETGRQELEVGEGNPVPLGPERQLFPLTATATGATLAPGPAGAAASVTPDTLIPIAVARDTLNAGGAFPPDPNAAADSRPGGQVVLTTSNTVINVSTDGGRNFTSIDPLARLDFGDGGFRPTLFPQMDGGLCCDQVVTYVPHHNIFVWVLQYFSTSGAGALKEVLPGKPTSNRLRIAWATPEGIRTSFGYALTWIDVTSSMVGLGDDWMDQPDVTFTDRFVYVSATVGKPRGGMDGRVYFRLSLDQMTDPTHPAVTGGSFRPPYGVYWSKTRFIQDSRDAMRIAGWGEAGRLRMLKWPDASVGPSPAVEIPISRVPGGDATDSNSPDGLPFLTCCDSHLGFRGTVFPSQDPRLSNAKEIVVAINAGKWPEQARPYPWIRFVRLVEYDQFIIGKGLATVTELVSEQDMWNPDHGFGLAELTTGLTRQGREVALIVSVGAGLAYPTQCFGLLADFFVYCPSGSNATHAIYQRNQKDEILKDSAGNNLLIVRYGDYGSVRRTRPAANGNDLFGALLYSIIATSPEREACAKPPGCTTPLRYIEWGRFDDVNNVPVPVPK